MFYTEPLPDESALWSLDNVLLSPHSTYLTAPVLQDSMRLFVDSVANFMAGEEVELHVVDKNAGY